ncbi:MAG TPA: hypothetical protein VIF14_18425 [Alphaproteobacteria bacterium]|jgi:hypothetical protein
MIRWLPLVALFALAPSLAAAQARGSPACKDAAMPFAATAANRLAGAAVSGKRFIYVRESLRTPGVWVKGTRELRADGSMRYTCEVSRSEAGPWRPCRSFGSVERQTAGSRDVGVWSIKNNAVCAAKASFGEQTEDCFALHRQGAIVAAMRVSGPRAACVQGTIILE